jgi:co-chaperonin GroES (HSP10)
MIQPLGNRVLISRMPEPKPVTSLIIQPDSVLDKPSQFGIVLAIGTKVRESLAVGDTVVLRDFSGAPVSADMAEGIDNAFMIVEDDILGVLNA